MKLSGMAGTGRGKMGSMVYATIAGEQVVRQYQPAVANPNTEGQVDSRAKLKLMSQIAQAISPVITYQRTGLVSARNKFIKRNYPLAMASEGVALVSYENLQLTPGNTSLPQLAVARAAETGVTISLAAAAAADIARVVYIVYAKDAENKLQLLSSAIVTEAGENRTFSGVLPYAAGELVIYGYGIKDANAKASAQFGDYGVVNGTDVAKLVASRAISASDFTFTETRGATLGSSASDVTPTPAGQARVFLTANGNGTVAGAGTFAIGSSVTVTATPNSGTNFVGWSKNGVNGYVSTAQSYTFTLEGTTDLVANFETPSGGGGSYGD